MSEFKEFDAQGWIEKLRTKAAASIDVVAAAERDEDEDRRHLLDRRAAKLRAAGDCDPDIGKLAIESIARCPRVAGHAGSMAAAAAVERLIGGKGRTLLLLGPTGRGKSAAATWSVIAANGKTAWIAATECRVGLWDEVRPKATNAALLVVDDLGRESSDWAVREWSDLLELRHNRGRLTIVTSNLTLPQLVSRYGERLESRWADERYTAVVKVLGPDLRKQGKATQ